MGLLSPIARYVAKEPVQGDRKAFTCLGDIDGAVMLAFPNQNSRWSHGKGKVRASPNVFGTSQAGVGMNLPVLVVFDAG